MLVDTVRAIKTYTINCSKKRHILILENILKRLYDICLILINFILLI
jgi:hypothetical protein